MQIKTFRALDMREALRAVKEELGPDAVILSTQEIKNGDPVFGLFSRAMVEVTAAVDRADARPAPRPGPAERTANHAAALPHAGARPSAPFSDQIMAAAALQPLRDDLAQLKEDIRRLRGLSDRPRIERPAPPPASMPWDEELRGMRRLVGSLVKDDQVRQLERLPHPLALIHDRLSERGLDQKTALSVVRELEQTAPPADRERSERIETTLRDILSRQAQVAGPLLERAGRGKAVMIVGPTGVGKTTTIAKLAAQYALKQKRKVSLITLDTYRVAAVEQLRVYADIMKLPVDVALTCKDLTAFLRAREGADLILIDTAGRSPLDEAALREIKKFSISRMVEAHLVLSASTREADMDAIVARFAVLPVHRLIFSKLDETTSFGPIFNVARRAGLPLSYLCAGQCVPDDLELATPRALTDLLLDGLPAPRRTATA
jgi:flagellar biosynthesis protein FlhF